MQLSRWRFVPTPGWPTVPDDPACRVLRHDELDAIEQDQLVAAAGRGSSLVFTVEALFGPAFEALGGDAGWIATRLETPFEVWDVTDEAGAPRFQLWLYGADAGLLFAAGTTHAVAQAIQLGSAWERLDAAQLPDPSALGDAHRRAAREHPRSELAHFYPIDG